MAIFIESEGKWRFSSDLPQCNNGLHNSLLISLPKPDQDYSCYKALEKDTLAVISPSHGMQSFQ
jgi:hypothetical protein